MRWSGSDDSRGIAQSNPVHVWCLPPLWCRWPDGEHTRRVAGFDFSLGVYSAPERTAGSAAAPPGDGRAQAAGDGLLLVWVPLVVQCVWVMASGQTIGESATLLRGRSVRIPVTLSRPLRFLAGIGGYGMLAAASFPLSGLLLLVRVVASLVMVFVSRGHRGFAAMGAGMEVDDARVRSR